MHLDLETAAAVFLYCCSGAVVALALFALSIPVGEWLAARDARRYPPRYEE